ncbi:MULTISPECIES: hypothetical protein [Streptomyces]|uniref:hypothetical protein n=1 Tax=Streptomyces TaxID=1883 RepID=UPI000D51DF12|nr:MULTISPECIES: hypothetical protein [Streptomyces]MBB4160867.1 hypothetical protein [Streptomyces cinereoruber]MBY8820576.1 hypothetical protein [Streptomyces cinereoruber]NIH62333.1 hypothetical protein [Streptomyces cinereoruber]PVC77185.1 hypothetical protein DBP18_01930 [Streptomyces sp. CS081A]
MQRAVGKAPAARTHSAPRRSPIGAPITPPPALPSVPPAIPAASEAAPVQRTPAPAPVLVPTPDTTADLPQPTAPVVQRSTTQPPVTVVVPGLPRATASPAPRPDVLPLATGRALAPNLPGNTHAPASPRTPAVQAAPATSQPVVPLAVPTPTTPRPVVPLAPPAVARPVAVQRRSAPEAPTPPAPAPTPGPAPVPVPVPLQRTAVALPRTSAPAPAPRPATAPVQQATAIDPAAPSGSESPAQLDELARRLVTPLSRLLRAELRADRERVGRLRDHGR